MLTLQRVHSLHTRMQESNERSGPEGDRCDGGRTALHSGNRAGCPKRPIVQAVVIVIIVEISIVIYIYIYIY